MMLPHTCAPALIVLTSNWFGHIGGAGENEQVVVEVYKGQVRKKCVRCAHCKHGTPELRRIFEE